MTTILGNQDMKKIDILEHLYNLKERAEADYAQAIKLKDSRLIAAAIGRLNAIDRDILSEEHRRKEAKVAQDHPVDWNSPENRAIEAHRQYLIGQLECLTGKSIKEILDEGQKTKRKAG